MQLIGMLDSPYVRRVAVSLRLMGLDYEHRSLSVFGDFESFRAINPPVKAPTLVCDNGQVLMDSTLILDYAEHLPVRRRSLMPADLPQRQRTLRLIGLALVACEKAVQLVYERQLRPPEKQHEPWLARVGGQLRAACAELETELARVPLACTPETIDQAGVTIAVAWQFIQHVVPQAAPAADSPALGAYSIRAEALPEFMAVPYDDGNA